MKKSEIDQKGTAQYIQYINKQLSKNQTFISKYNSVHDLIKNKAIFRKTGLKESERRNFKNAFERLRSSLHTLDLIEKTFKLNYSFSKFMEDLEAKKEHLAEYFDSGQNEFNEWKIPKKKLLKILIKLPLSATIKNSKNATIFFSGHLPSWSDLQSNFDIIRYEYEKIDGIKNHLSALCNTIDTCKFFIIKGVAGSGKSTLLRRIAFDLNKMNVNVYYVNTEFSTLSDLIDIESEIKYLAYSHKNLSIFVIDGFTKLANSGLINLRKFHEDFINQKILFVLSDNNINLKVSKRFTFYPSNAFIQYTTLDLLKDSEVDDMIFKIQTLQETGELEKIHHTVSFEELRNMCKEEFGRQLIVAMMQIRKGIRFKEIIQAECDNLYSEESQRFIFYSYLSVCMFQTFDLPFFDDLLFYAFDKKRISGIHELDDYCSTNDVANESAGLMIYKNGYLFARHPIIAQVVFEYFMTAMIQNRVMPKPLLINEYFNLLLDSKALKNHPKFILFAKTLFDSKRSLEKLKIPTDCRKLFLSKFENFLYKDMDFRLNYVCSIAMEEEYSKKIELFEYILKNIKEDSFVLSQLSHAKMDGGLTKEAENFALKAISVAENEQNLLGAAKALERLKLNSVIPVLKKLIKSKDPYIIQESIKLFKKVSKFTTIR